MPLSSTSRRRAYITRAVAAQLQTQHVVEFQPTLGLEQFGAGVLGTTETDYFLVDDDDPRAGTTVEADPDARLGAVEL